MKNNDFKIDFITAPDGTKIAYRMTGSGPGLILVPGGLQSSLNFTTLARALATDFTVYIPDRRGRGLSGPYGPADNLQTEADDLLALISRTEAQKIFALSSGAIITLQAVLGAPHLTKIALYEPPLPVDDRTINKAVARYESAIANGNLGKAFVAILKGVGDPGERSFLTIFPAVITAPLVNFMIRRQAKKQDDNELSLKDLILTFHQDSIVARESLPLIEKAATIQADVLLLGGGKSQPYLTTALDRLETSFPHVRRVHFQRLGHLAADNTESPLLIAEELRAFFKNS